MSYFKTSYDTLNEVFNLGKYLAEALKSVPQNQEKNLVVRIVYGVLEKNVELEYYLSVLAEKKPQKAVRTILKIALYCLKYMDSIPNYAVCDNAVRLTKEVGKSSVAPFVNATLKRFIREGVKLPSDKIERLSVKTSTPLWLTKKMVKQYKEDAESILSYTPSTKGHVRVNSLKTTYDKVEKELISSKTEYEKSERGFYVSDSDTVRKLFSSGDITYQSESSMIIAETVAESKPRKILDVCAAPGGKSIYIYELTKGEVVSQDLHEHRVKLIQSYAERMGAKIKAKRADGLTYNPDYKERFDTVLLDAPCSGIGTRYTKPDVLLNREEKDIPEFAKTQQDLLNISKQYVKMGGFIVYSTCTLLYEENERVVERFLGLNPEFRLVYHEKRVPGKNSRDGFYVAKLERV